MIGSAAETVAIDLTAAMTAGVTAGTTARAIVGASADSGDPVRDAPTEAGASLRPGRLRDTLKRMESER